jgi:hypothetical protein
MSNRNEVNIFLSETALVTRKMRYFDFSVPESDVFLQLRQEWHPTKLLPTTSRLLSNYLVYLRRKQTRILTRVDYTKLILM